MSDESIETTGFYNRVLQFFGLKSQAPSQKTTKAAAEMSALVQQTLDELTQALSQSESLLDSNTKLSVIPLINEGKRLAQSNKNETDIERSQMWVMRVKEMLSVFSEEASEEQRIEHIKSVAIAHMIHTDIHKTEQYAKIQVSSLLSKKQAEAVERDINKVLQDAFQELHQLKDTPEKHPHIVRRRTLDKVLKNIDEIITKSLPQQVANPVVKELETELDKISKVKVSESNRDALILQLAKCDKTFSKLEFKGDIDPITIKKLHEKLDKAHGNLFAQS